MEEVDILVSSKAIRSGGRKQVARLVKAVKFLMFLQGPDIEKVESKCFVREPGALGGRREVGEFGPGFISISRERRRVKRIFRRMLTADG